MRLIALCALVLVALPVAAQPRHAGTFAYPGSGGDCPALYVTTRPVQAYAEPRAVGTPVRRVDAGRRIDLNDRSEGLTVVTAVGRAVARRDVSVTEWGYHDSSRRASGPLRIPRGTRVEILGEAGAGYSFFKMAGVVYSAQDGPAGAAWMVEDGDRGFEVESWPRAEHWVRLVARGGRPAAWLNVSQPGVRETGLAGDLCE